jgi:hypothetical protein
MPNSQNYQTPQKSELLQMLLMFVSYCAYELKWNVRLIPSVMSGIRHGMVTRLVPFDDELLTTVKQGVSKLHQNKSPMYSWDD